MCLQARPAPVPPGRAFARPRLPAHTTVLTDNARVATTSGCATTAAARAASTRARSSGCSAPPMSRPCPPEGGRADRGWAAGRLCARGRAPASLAAAAERMQDPMRPGTRPCIRGRVRANSCDPHLGLNSDLLERPKSGLSTPTGCKKNYVLPRPDSQISSVLISSGSAHWPTTVAFAPISTLPQRSTPASSMSDIKPSSSALSDYVQLARLQLWPVGSILVFWPVGT
jgi:hypothetical protein